MSNPGWEGLAALQLLMRLRWRARVRSFLHSMRQPKRVLLVLLAVGLLGLIVAGQLMDADSNLFARDALRPMFPLFLLFFMITTVLTALANGVLAFSPPEVQFLFPAPIGNRALLGSHLLNGSIKSLSAAVFFGLIFRPGSASVLQGMAAFALLFFVLTLLGVVVDLGVMHLPRSQRKQLARRVFVALLLVAGITVALTARADGGWSPQAVRHLGLPVRPFTLVLQAQDTADAWRGVGVSLILIGLLLLRPLGFRGDLREGAAATSERVQQQLDRMRKSNMPIERARPRTGGRTLAMLPRWGGAGVHAWRQLATLLRLRTTYAMLLFMTVTVGVVSAVVGHAAPEAAVGAMLGMLTFGGPMYVQCDFRSDYDNLAWLRSLPTPAALAAGQILASCLVLYVMQLAVGAWLLFALEQRQLLWLGILLSLPLLNAIQLCVENGTFLLYPFRLNYAKGPPGAVQIGRMYALMIMKFAVLLAVLVAAALPAVAAHALFKNALITGLTGYAMLVVEVILLVWLVGRLFVRVDPGRDLGN